MARMLVTIIGIICGGWAGFGLTFKITEGLFGGKSDDGILAVDFFLRKMIHAKPHAGFRTQRNDAKAF